MAVGAVGGWDGQFHPAHGLGPPGEQRALPGLADEDARAQQPHRNEPGPAARAAVALEGGAQLHLVAVEIGAVLEGQLVVGDRDGVLGGAGARLRVAGAEGNVARLAGQPGAGVLVVVARGDAQLDPGGEGGGLLLPLAGDLGPDDGVAQRAFAQGGLEPPVGEAGAQDERVMAPADLAVLGEGDRHSGGREVVEALREAGPVQGLAHLALVVQRGPHAPVPVPELGQVAVAQHQRRHEERGIRAVQGVQDRVGEGLQGVRRSGGGSRGGRGRGRRGGRGRHRGGSRRRCGRGRGPLVGYEALGADLAAQVHRVLAGEVPRHRRLGVRVRAGRSGRTAVPAREAARVLRGVPVEADHPDRPGGRGRLSCLAHHQGALHPVERHGVVADAAGHLAGGVRAEVVAPARAEIGADKGAALEAYIGLGADEGVVGPGGDLDAEAGVADVRALVLVRGLREVANLRLDRLRDQRGPVRDRPLDDQMAQRVLPAAPGQFGSAHGSGEPPEEAEEPPGTYVRDQRAVGRTAGARTGDGERHILRRVREVEGGRVGDPWFGPVREGQRLRGALRPLEGHGEVVRQPPAQPVPHGEGGGVHLAALPTGGGGGRGARPGGRRRGVLRDLGDPLDAHSVVDVVQMQVGPLPGPVLALVVRLGALRVVGLPGPAQ
ncbi:hypothetical protein P376_2124 [Streptomyces sp. HCCB10043]|nr:hypothetical protein P376_2124 [Streptomyces sp. HCCB10043]